MTNSIKAFRDVKETHTSYLVFVDIFEPIVNDAMQTSLRGMAFQICWLVKRDKKN